MLLYTVQIIGFHLRIWFQCSLQNNISITMKTIQQCIHPNTHNCSGLHFFFWFTVYGSVNNKWNNSCNIILTIATLNYQYTALLCISVEVNHEVMLPHPHTHLTGSALFPCHSTYLSIITGRIGTVEAGFTGRHLLW